MSLTDHHILEFAGRSRLDQTATSRNYDCECLFVSAGVARVSVGFAGMSKQLKREGVDTEIIFVDTPLHEFTDARAVDASAQLMELARFSGPRLVAFSIHWHPQIQVSLKLAELLKSLPQFASTKVLVGGITVGVFAEQFVRLPCIDFVVQGDGEQPVVSLVQQLRRGPEASFDLVPNLFYKDADGEVRKSPENWRVTNEVVQANEADVVADSALFRKTGYVLVPGRGCPHQCNFCGGSRDSFKRWSPNGKLMARSPEYVRPFVKAVTDNGEKRLYLLNDYDRKGSMMRKSVSGLPVPDELTLDLFGLPKWENIKGILDETTKSDEFRLVLEISPETGSETARQFTRGLFYANAEIESALDTYFSESTAVHVILFFSFFHTSDLDEWKVTREYVAHLTGKYLPYVTGERPRLSLALLPLSTDPGNQFQTANVSGIVSTLHGLDDYVRKMCEQRLVLGNFLQHRPEGMSVEDVERIRSFIYFENVLRGASPALYLNIMSFAGSFERYEALMWRAFEPVWRLVLKRSGTQSAFSRSMALRMSSLFGFWFFYDELPYSMFAEHAPVLLLWLSSLVEELKADLAAVPADDTTPVEWIGLDGERAPDSRLALGQSALDNLEMLVALTSMSAANASNGRLMFTEFLSFNHDKAARVGSEAAALADQMPVRSPAYVAINPTRLLVGVPAIRTRENLLHLGERYFGTLLSGLSATAHAEIGRLMAADGESNEPLPGAVWRRVVEGRSPDLCSALSRLFVHHYVDREAFATLLRDRGARRATARERTSAAFVKVSPMFGVSAVDIRLVAFYLRWQLLTEGETLLAEPGEVSSVVVGEYFFAPTNGAEKPSSVVVEVGELGRRILEHCDGTHTIERIEAHVRDSADPAATDAATFSPQAVRDAVTYLYAMQVIY